MPGPDRRGRARPAASSPASTRDGAPAPAGVDREVVGAGRSPTSRRRPSSASRSSGPTPCPGRERRSSRRLCWRRALWSRRMPFVAGRRREQGRRVGRSGGRRRRRPARCRSCRGRGSGAGPTGSSVGIVMWTGVPSPTCWPRCGGRVGVEGRGEEDRAALRRRSRGPRARRAGGGSRGRLAHVADVGRAAPQDGDVEGVDLDLHELLGAGAAGSARRRRTRRATLRARSRGSAAGASSRRPSRRSTGRRAAA